MVKRSRPKTYKGNHYYYLPRSTRRYRVFKENMENEMDEMENYEEKMEDSEGEMEGSEGEMEDSEGEMEDSENEVENSDNEIAEQIAEEIAEGIMPEASGNGNHFLDNVLEEFEEMAALEQSSHSQMNGDMQVFPQLDEYLEIQSIFTRKNSSDKLTNEPLYPGNLID